VAAGISLVAKNENGLEITLGVAAIIGGIALLYNSILGNNGINYSESGIASIQ